MCFLNRSQIDRLRDVTALLEPVEHVAGKSLSE